MEFVSEFAVPSSALVTGSFAELVCVSEIKHTHICIQYGGDVFCDKNSIIGFFPCKIKDDFKLMGLSWISLASLLKIDENEYTCAKKNSRTRV
jgi:hypothetical protein